MRVWRPRGGAEAHTQRQCGSARARAKRKRGLKVDSSNYMVSLRNPKRSARSARPSASPTLPCPSARATYGPHGRLALVPQGCNRPCSQAFPQQEQSFPSRQIPKVTIFSRIHSAKYWKSWISLLPFLNFDFAFHLFLSFSTFIAFSRFPF